MPSRAQAKEGGRKTVLTMSSAMGIISRASEASRDVEKPLGLFDGIMVAYKASKSAVTQGTRALRPVALCELAQSAAAAESCAMPVLMQRHLRYTTACCLPVSTQPVLRLRSAHDANYMSMRWRHVILPLSMTA